VSRPLWKGVLRQFAPPEPPGRSEDAVATSVWVFALAVVVAAVPGLIAALVVPGVRYGAEAPLLVLVSALATLALVRRGRAIPGGWLLLASYLIALSWALLRAGTLQSPGSSLFVVAILFGGLLDGTRGALLVSALVGALLLGLDALFETPLSRSLRLGEPDPPSAVWWLPLPFLVGVLVATWSQRVLHRTSEAKLSEAEREASEGRYRAVVENAPLGVALFDTELRVTHLNPETCRMLGIDSAGEILGRDVGELPSYQLPRVREAFEAVLERGERVSFEADWTSPAGRRVLARLYGAPVRDDGGALVGVVVLMADVSAQRRLEEQLLQAQKLEAVGRLAGGVAHDFNNQLTVILGTAEALSTQVARELVAEVDQISSAAKSSAALTRQLLAFSRRQILEPRILNLNAVVAELDPLLRRTLGAGVEVGTVLGPALWNVLADPIQLQTALLNLATNARDAMGGRGKLTIETANVQLDRDYLQGRGASPGQYVMLSVTDDGAGMDAEAQTHVFEPFFTTKPVGEGTGLGLSTVHGIVSQSGGLIQVDSKPGQGTTFRIHLPRAEGVPMAEPAPQPRPRGGSERLLLVEDDPTVRPVLARVLRDTGYHVLEAADGQAASELAAQSPDFDLLISDLVMPRVGGVELAARLRATRPALRVLYVSGYADGAALRSVGRELGTALLAKPFTPADLLVRVREILDG